MIRHYVIHPTNWFNTVVYGAMKHNIIMHNLKLESTEILEITFLLTSSARLFEMIIYWFFLKNVTFYFTKKLETRANNQIY